MFKQVQLDLRVNHATLRCADTRAGSISYASKFGGQVGFNEVDMR